METRKGLDTLAVGLMMALCMLWGLQQVVLKLAAVDIAPVMLIALRSGVAAVLVALFMLWRKLPITIADGTLRPGLAVGVLFALEFLLVAQALQYSTASHVVVFLYTAPIFVALGLHFRLAAERLGALQWLGIALAFAGIVVAFLWHRPGADKATLALPQQLLGDVLALAGGAAWAATTVVVRLSSLSRAPAAQTLLYQLVVAFVLLVLAAFALGQAHINATPLMWGSLLFQGVLVSFISYLLWFWLLRQYVASQLGVFSFLTPLWGVGFGVWLLGEPLEPSFMAGAVLVLAGVALVSGHGWIVARLARRAGSLP